MIFKKRLKDIYYYSTKNLAFLALVAFLFFLLSILEGNDTIPFAKSIVSILNMGYGLEITRDTIRGGKRLPKMRPKKIIFGGVKLFIITIIYFIPQIIFFTIIKIISGFNKIFQLGDIFFHIPDFYDMFNINPVRFVFYIILFLIISYISIFFYEIALASFAETDKFMSAFRLKRIWRKIRKVGIKNYVIRYTELIILMSLFTLLADCFFDFPVIYSVILLVPFLLQYRAMGLLYKKYILN